MGKKVILNLNIKKMLPFIIFILLFVILFVSTNLSLRSPVVGSINPKIGIPGGELVIKGKYFGKDRKGGKVSVGGIYPPTDSYQEWQDNRIRLIIHEDMVSGLLKVITRVGESKELVPFVNRKQFPKPLIGPLKAGEAYIQSITPDKGSVGSIVTIKGINFSGERGGSEVYFAWMSGDKEQSEIEAISSTSIPAALNDYDYIFWDDNEIKVRVPDGACSGNMFISTGNVVSNAEYFEVQEPVGQKTIDDQRIYQVYSSVKIKVIDAEPDNGLYIWVPGVLETNLQREITLISSSPEIPDDKKNNIMQFYFKNLLPGETQNIKQRYLFKRFAVSTKININKVIGIYNKESELYKKYTAKDPLIPALNIKAITITREIVGREKNPYLKAHDIYNYVLNKLSFNPEDFNLKNYEIKSIESILNDDKSIGDAYVYSILFCILARTAGIPSRPVSGYLACSDLTSTPHYWAEFYLEQFGWIPVDPYLGDGNKYPNFNRNSNYKNYYFGNIDNGHITITKGIEEIKQISHSGKIIKRRRTSSLQSIFEESIGNLHSYTTSWSPLGIMGFY